ncbi:AraC-like DNA-binding protein [Catalinimonas alkaloidigena]|uniref:nickel-binding protein n=1 Tax=Catalinimonas alkaloidigena TaxID=1075417 RepID=UPI002407372D|nr:nickel-binding protein [Catalinimonas alkaloidigena]MDF9799986.1 AraC-like DNA-binding protein [Catalinimonas alkaloidigena]
MPIFMDRHDVPGVTAIDVAEAHQEDLKIQSDYDCRALTYWFDEERGMAFCLIEAPDEASVQNLHDYAHGLIPNQIIEVQPKVVEAFLGRIKDPEEQDAANPIINDPAFRSIMVIGLDEITQIQSKSGKQVAIDASDKFKETLERELNKHNGLKVEHSDNCFMASFASVTQSVLCALAIQQCFKEHNATSTEHQIYARIGLSAGVPVSTSGSDGFFGDTVKLAKRLCFTLHTGQVAVASLVSELYNAQKLNIRTEENTLSSLSPSDEDFLNQAMELMETNACAAGFDVETFSKHMGISKPQLYRKTTAISGYSPNDFIKEFRLKKALQLIEQQSGNISEIAYDAGFNSLSYFSKCFQKRFGILPSDYAHAIA